MKKLIAMAIVLCMVIGMIPMIASAAGNYYVAGDAALCGQNWASSDENNKMVDNGNGIYTKTYSNVAAGTYSCKVTDGTWNNSWGDNGQNYTFKVNSACDVTITFDSNAKTVKASGAGVGAVTGLDVSVMRIAGNGKTGWLNGASWDVAAAANSMTVDGDVYTITYENVPVGNGYEFKFVANGSWSSCWGGSFQGSGVESAANWDGANIKFNVTGEPQDVTLELDLSNFDYASKSGAMFTITIGGEVEAPPAAPELSKDKITVYAKSSFAAPNLYGWVSKDGTDLFDPGEWPGAPMTQIGTSAWFSMEISKDIANVIINNGSGQQTVDVTLDAAKPYLLVLNETDEAGHYKVAAFATQAEADAYQPGDEPVNPPAPPAGNAEDFYLVGYINGADHGTEGDAANLGNYKFVDGKLTATFTADSYVFVKTGDNSHWYLAETYCTEKSVVLVENAPEKLFVPGNVEVTFTLVKNADGTLTLSYVVAGQPDEGGDESGNAPEEGGEIKYVVVGNWEAAGNWTPDTSTLVMTEADGRYTWTGTVPAGNYELKVVRLQGSNATWIPDGMGNNITFTVTAESEITVSYDAAEGVKVDGEKVEWPEEEGNEEQPSGDVTYAVLGSFNEWNAETAITMTKNANGTFTAKVTGLAAGEYELKVLGSDGKWYPAENVKVTLTASGEITVTFDKNAGTVTAVASEAGAPTETKPAESKPTETKPAETKPTETKPTETKPAETQPAETKPAETQPTETKPTETKPTETKPAEVTEITVYAKVPEDWENPGVWAWNDKQENAFDAWPGLAMTKGENGWWYAKVPAWVENVIINANGGSYQTADLDLAQLKCDVWVEVTVDANGVAQAELKYASPATGDETALVSAAAVMLFAAMGVVALVNGKKYF